MIYFVKKKISGAVFVFLDEVLWAFVRLFQDMEMVAIEGLGVWDLQSEFHPRVLG